MQLLVIISYMLIYYTCWFLILIIIIIVLEGLMIPLEPFLLHVEFSPHSKLFQALRFKQNWNLCDSQGI